jgi:hypothetical protein
LPRWFAEQQGLPPEGDHLIDAEVEDWLARTRLTASAAQEHVQAHPQDAEAQAQLDRAVNELAAAMLFLARRQGVLLASA